MRDSNCSQQKVSVGYSADEDAALSKISADVVEHTSRLRLRFECVVHAKLHRNDVEWRAQYIWWQCATYGFGKAVECEEESFWTGASQ